MTNNSNGYASDFSSCSSGGTRSFTACDINNSCLTGYAKSKAEEMFSKGASSCFVYNGGVAAICLLLIAVILASTVALAVVVVVIAAT